MSKNTELPTLSSNREEVVEDPKLINSQDTQPNVRSGRVHPIERQETKSNLPEELKRSSTSTHRKTKAELRASLITHDSFVDDFGFKRIRTSLSVTAREGKQVKAKAPEKVKSGKKERDSQIAKNTKLLLWNMVFQ